MLRSALFAVLLLGGCTSSTAAPADLAAPGCTLAVSGDESGTIACGVRFCRTAAADDLQIYGLATGSFQGVFDANGGFTTGRTYGAADLGTFDVSARFDFARSYAAGNDVSGSTVALSFDAIEPNDDAGCAGGNATVHGHARITLTENVDADAGTVPARHATVDASF